MRWLLANLRTDIDILKRYYRWERVFALLSPAIFEQNLSRKCFRGVLLPTSFLQL